MGKKFITQVCLVNIQTNIKILFVWLIWKWKILCRWYAEINNYADRLIETTQTDG